MELRDWSRDMVDISLHLWKGWNMHYARVYKVQGTGQVVDALHADKLTLLSEQRFTSKLPLIRTLNELRSPIASKAKVWVS